MWAQRDRLLAELPSIVGVGRILGGSSANFLLVRFLNKSAAEGEVPDDLVAMAVYEALESEEEGGDGAVSRKGVWVLGLRKNHGGNEERG